MTALLFFILFQAGATSNAGISGTVIEAGRVYNAPLFHARVELGIDTEVLKVTRTDENGQFAFLGLPAGKYRLSVTDEGFIRKTKTITLTGGQSQTDLQFALSAASTIVGHIKDESNTPISNLLVEAMKVVYGPRGDKALTTVAASLTDDRGEYHLYWLDPGAYVIRATLPGSTSSDIAQTKQPAAAYPPTYFPGFRDPDDATPIRIGTGTVTNAIDFKLQGVPPVAVGGIVTIATGEPVGTMVTLNPVSGSAGTRQYTRSLDNSSAVPLKMRGSFAFEEVPPGTYILSAETGMGDNRQNGFTRIQISDRSDQSVYLKLRSGSEVSGQMLQESGGRLDLRLAKVALQSIDPASSYPPAVSTDATGKFALKAVPAGNYSIVVQGLPGNAYLKTARSGSLDILANALQIDGKSQTIQIVLGVDGGSIDGIVLDNANRPFPDAEVILIPDTSRRNRPNEYLTGTFDSSGKFRIEGIPPGDYKLFGWQNIEENAYKNPIFLQQYESLGMPVTVPPNGFEMMSVRMIPID